MPTLDENTGAAAVAEAPAIPDGELAERMREAAERIGAEIRKRIIGQEQAVEEVLISLFVGGNSIITGVPGLAKTLIVQTLSEVLALRFQRIQFTPDLMPSDITGTDIIQENPETGKRNLVFVPGPVFANIVLADEINRTPPKTQSALLEAMQEHQVTVQGRTYPLPEPYFVFATQNPIELEGTYPLPEAQLDRFLFNIIIDYLPVEQEREVVRSTTSDPGRGASERPLRGGTPRLPAAGAPGAGLRAGAGLRGRAGATQPSRRTGRAGLRQRAGPVRRERAGGAVLGARREGAGIDARPASRGDRGRAGAGGPPIFRHRVLPNFHAQSEKVDSEDIAPAADRGRPGARLADVTGLLASTDR